MAMLHLVIRLALLGTVLSACSSGEQGGVPLEVRVGINWRDCVYRSFAAQRSLTPDQAMAVELAFQACRSEERAVYVLTAARGDYADAEILTTAAKARMKNNLISSPRSAQQEEQERRLRKFIDRVVAECRQQGFTPGTQEEVNCRFRFAATLDEDFRRALESGVIEIPKIP